MDTLITQDIIRSTAILILFGAATVFTLRHGAEVIADAIQDNRRLSIYYGKQVLGILAMGVLPLFATSLLWPLLKLPAMGTGLALVFAGLSAMVFMAGWMAGRQFHPGSRVPMADPERLKYFLPLRAGFLVSYELFFRGTFLPALMGSFSELNSILINTFFYSLLHAGNDKKEWLGAIPFGMALCKLTIETGSVWPAVVMHLLLSLSNEPAKLKKAFMPLKNQSI